MEFIDLSTPDYHFWHSWAGDRTYAHARDRWCATGNPEWLRVMLDGIAYSPGPPNTHVGWDQADDWRDEHIFGTTFR